MTVPIESLLMLMLGHLFSPLLNDASHDSSSPKRLGLGLRLRSLFRLASEGYVKFFRQETLPNNDTGIVAQTVTERRYFLSNRQSRSSGFSIRLRAPESL